MPINMSYCRFQNTLEALKECYAALSESDLPSPEKELSEEEHAAFRRLLRVCENFVEDFGE